MQTINEVPMIVRREIEARMVAPILNAFAEELGWEKTEEITRRAIAQIAEEAGAQLAQAVGGNSLSCLGKAVACFSQDGVLTQEIKRNDDECIQMDVTSCGYVEMYKRIGLEKLGSLLSCERDAYLFKGFNPDIAFTRSGTRMTGAAVCDFCLQNKD